MRLSGGLEGATGLEFEHEERDRWFELYQRDDGDDGNDGKR